MSGTVFLFLDSLGGGEVFIIVLVMIMFFGSDKLPGIIKTLGKGIREINEMKAQVQNEIQKNTGNLQAEIRKHTSDLQSEIENAGRGITKQLNDVNTTMEAEGKAITDTTKE